MISLEPVAYFSSIYTEKADLPRQGSLAVGYEGIIRFLPGKNFEQALEDLEGMEKLWVLFWMHASSRWKPKIQPPRASGKKGVFATRSPHRPNPIGLSCVSLVAVKGRDLWIKDHDLLDGTPILDIKPYLVYADSFPKASMGWLDPEKPLARFFVSWSTLASRQAAYLKEEKVDLRLKIEQRLVYFSGPSSSNRITALGNGTYWMAYRSWRFVLFQKDQEIEVAAVLSGYDLDDPTASGEDLELHRAFTKRFFQELSETFVQNEKILYIPLKTKKKGIVYGKDL